MGHVATISLVRDMFDYCPADALFKTKSAMLYVLSVHKLGNLSLASKEKIVSKACEYYLDSSKDVDDPNLELAARCLELVKEDSSVLQKYHDILTALSMVNEFGISILPLVLRNMTNYQPIGTWPMFSLQIVNKQMSIFKNVNKQLSFLEKCKQSAVTFQKCQQIAIISFQNVNKQLTWATCHPIVHKILQLDPAAFKNVRKILRMFKLLNVGNVNEAPLLSIIADYALKAEDFDYGLSICHMMMEKPSKEACKVCLNLVHAQNFADGAAKANLTSFCVNYCDDEDIEEMLMQRVNLTDVEAEESSMPQQPQQPPGTWPMSMSCPMTS